MSDSCNQRTETLSNPIVSPTPNDLKKAVKIQDFPNMMNHVTPAGISRERSFIRSSNPQGHHQVLNKRRSMGFQQQQQQIRMKPALEIYRPPSRKLYFAKILFSWKGFSLLSDIRFDMPQNKLNVHAQEFNMNLQQRGMELQNSRCALVHMQSYSNFSCTSIF